MTKRQKKEAVRALEMQLDGYRIMLRQGTIRQGDFNVAHDELAAKITAILVGK